MKKFSHTFTDSLKQSPQTLEVEPTDSFISLYNEQKAGKEEEKSLPKIQTLKNFFAEKDSPNTIETVNFEYGKPGTLVPYSMRTDDFITGLLLGSFLLSMIFMANNPDYLKTKIKNLFCHDHNVVTSTIKTTSEIYFQFFFVFFNSLLLGIFYYYYTDVLELHLHDLYPPHLLLGTFWGTFLLFYILKIGLYAGVNNIFFSKTKNKKWHETYLTVISLQSIALFPLTLLIIYFNIPLKESLIIALFILSIFKIVLFFRCIGIFFNHFYGLAHLILYFCTLEIAPSLLLWKSLIYINNFFQ